MPRSARAAAALCLALGACSGRALYDSYVQWARYRVGLKEAHVRAAGLNVPYLRGGSGQALVLLHGLGADKDAWLDFVAQLPDGFLVLAPDLAGFGESADEPSVGADGFKLDVFSQAERVHAFIHRLGLGRVHLFGSSMGGAVAVAYALRHGEGLLSSTLASPAGVRAPVDSDTVTLIGQGDNPLLFDSPAGLRRMLALSFSKPPAIPDSVTHAIVEQARARRALTARAFAELRDLDFGDALSAAGRAPRSPLSNNLFRPAKLRRQPVDTRA